LPGFDEVWPHFEHLYWSAMAESLLDRDV